MRSLRMGSTPFHSATEATKFWNRLHTPPMPSSLQRYARDRAISCVQ